MNKPKHFGNLFTWTLYLSVQTAIITGVLIHILLGNTIVLVAKESTRTPAAAKSDLVIGLENPITVIFLVVILCLSVLFTIRNWRYILLASTRKNKKG